MSRAVVSRPRAVHDRVVLLLAGCLFCGVVRARQVTELHLAQRWCALVLVLVLGNRTTTGVSSGEMDG